MRWRRDTGGRRRPSARSRRVALAGLLVALVLGGGLATAAQRDPGYGRQLEATVRYLQAKQNPDGGFGYEAGRPSDPGVSAWVAYALASFGVNPQDQKQPGGVDAHTYLARNAVGKYATDWERMALVAIASCTPPRDFGGVDLVARILAHRLPDGSFEHEPADDVGGVNDTAFAVLALSRVDDDAARAAIPAAVDWLLGAQLEDGSWGWSTRYASRSVDMTGAVIEALRAGGRPDTEHEARGFAYIRSLRNADGGFPQNDPDEPSNVASTAWAVQAMWAAGHDVPREALDYLAARQQPDGSIQYMEGVNQNNLWMTAQVAPAFAGRELPIACVPRTAPPAEPSPPAATATPAGPSALSDGQGGAAVSQGEGVIAGGGGEGAPLFSRPQPQSRGRTAGGKRELDREKARERRRTPPQPEATATPVPIETATPEPSAPTPAASPAPGGDALPYVTGTLVSGGATDGAAAPGLRGAGAGGTGDGLARAIGLALVAAIALGFVLEARPRRRS